MFEIGYFHSCEYVRTSVRAAYRLQLSSCQLPARWPGAHFRPTLGRDADFGHLPFSSENLSILRVPGRVEHRCVCVMCFVNLLYLLECWLNCDLSFSFCWQQSFKFGFCAVCVVVYSSLPRLPLKSVDERPQRSSRFWSPAAGSQRRRLSDPKQRGSARAAITVRGLVHGRSSSAAEAYYRGREGSVSRPARRSRSSSVNVIAATAHCHNDTSLVRHTTAR